MSPISQTILHDLNIDIKSLAGVTQDSRQVGQDYLFAALQGAVDGRGYIPDALMKGAAIILSDPSVVLKGQDQKKLVTHSNPRAAFAHVVAAFYNAQPQQLVAVTGTNGKSSVVHFIDQIWRSLGLSSSFLGTLSGAMTTPDPVVLHEKLSKMVDDGVTHAAMEASSHGLVQHRMDGVRVSVAAFTSFSQDHLDYHTDMDGYLQAKARLFTDVLSADGVAVLNADISEFQTLYDMCAGRGIKTLSYGMKGADIKLLSRSVVGGGQKIEIEVLGQNHTLNLPLVGAFQVMNVLCALGCVLAQNSDLTNMIKALPNLQGVPGRLQSVTTDKNTHHAYVDYAHTPDALENVLDALRPHTDARLFCVFGAGGDRDKSKRPKMGEAVARGADVALVTDDNPRSECPDAIRSEILSEMNSEACDVYEVVDRREAIARALSLMTSKDILLVAGKGHEQGQVFANITHPFDDVTEVRNAMRKIDLSK